MKLVWITKCENSYLLAFQGEAGLPVYVVARDVVGLNDLYATLAASTVRTTSF